MMPSKTMKTTGNHLSRWTMALVAVVFALALPGAKSFTSRTQAAFKPRIRGTQPTNSALSAWSLSAPAFSTPTLGTTWYNEVNPTGRRTVYDE